MCKWCTMVNIDDALNTSLTPSRIDLKDPVNPITANQLVVTLPKVMVKAICKKKRTVRHACKHIIFRNSSHVSDIRRL